MTDRFDEYRIDRRDESEAAERTRERREDVRDDPEYQPLSEDSSRSVARSEASVERSYKHGDGWHGGHTEWDHEIDQGPQDHDGRANTRTGFDPRDADNPERYKRLVPWQEGQWTSDVSRDTANNKADQRRWCQTFCSRLDVHGHQRERVMAIIEGVPRIDKMGVYKTEVIILAAISIVANENDRWIRDESGYRRLLRDLGASLRDIRKCRQLLKRKSEVL